MAKTEAVDAYSGVSGIGTVGAKDLSSSFTASVHAPQSVLPPLPSMTSWESSHWVPHSSLKVSRRVSFGSTAMGAGGVGVDIGAGATGVVFVRLKNLLNMAFNISSGSSLRESNVYPKANSETAKNTAAFGVATRR